MIGDPNFYAVLGVRPDASPAEISHAYRKLLRLHHPDSQAEPPAAPGTSDDLERILSAYAVLRDPDRRAEYDKRRLRAVALPSSTPRVRLRVNWWTEPPEAEPPIRAGPVRYHGRPTDGPH
jgi:curved DNA-binding protein CbpA